MKRCTKCKKMRKHFPPGRPRCRACFSEDRNAYYQKNAKYIRGQVKAWRDADPARNQRCVRDSRYGLAKGSFVKMFNRQDGKCIICKVIFAGDIKPHIDHDHNCCPEKEGSCGKCVRGLLCRRCNLALGNFRDDITFLKNAVKYLQEYK